MKFTSPEQVRQLKALGVNQLTADMHYAVEGVANGPKISENEEPCWSVDGLIKCLPQKFKIDNKLNAELKIDKTGVYYFILDKDINGKPYINDICNWNTGDLFDDAYSAVCYILKKTVKLAAIPQ